MHVYQRTNKNSPLLPKKVPRSRKSSKDHSKKFKNLEYKFAILCHYIYGCILNSDPVENYRTTLRCLWGEAAIHCSVAKSCLTLCDPVDCSTPVSPSFTVSRNLLKLMSIEPVMPSNHLILCCPLLPLPSIFPSIRVFSNKSALRIRRPNYWSFNISPSNEIQGWFLLGLRFLDKPQSSSMSTEKPILMKIYCDSTVVCYLDSTSGNNSLPRQTLGVLAADSLQLSACSELTQTQRTA